MVILGIRNMPVQGRLPFDNKNRNFRLEVQTVLFRPFHWNVSEKYGNAQMYSSFPIPNEMTRKFCTIRQNHGQPGPFSHAFQL